MRNRGKGRKSASRRRSGIRAYVGFALAATALAAVLVFPSPRSVRQGGIELCGDDPTAEIYGPTLPETVVGGYTAPVIQSVVLEDSEADAEENPEDLYYAADGETIYHRYTCSKAYASSNKFTLYEAYYLGYTPCEMCNPPVYTPET